MASQRTNLVPSSQAHSCTMHGFAAAEGGLGVGHEVASKLYASSVICLHPGCGAAFSSAEALNLHARAHDFGNLDFQDHGIKDTSAGYGPPPGYSNDLFKDGGTADFYTGYADLLNAPLGNNTGAVHYGDYDWNTTYTPVPVVDDIVGSGSGTGYAVSTGYHNDMLTANIAANGYTGYTDPRGASLGNNAGAAPYVDYGWNPAYTAALTVNSAVGSDSGTGYGVSTGYHNDLFTADIAANGYTGYADPHDASLGNNAGATAYVDYGWDPTSCATPAVNNIVGSGFGSGSGTESGMPPLQANMGAYHPVGPPAPPGPARVPCTHLNCGRTFGRPSDMARHAKKHETNPVRYPCPVPGCTFVGAKAFLRHDKLLSHGRNAHGMEI